MFDTCNRLDYDEAQSAQNICVNMTGANYLEGELAGVKLDHGCSLLRNFRLYAGFKNFYNPLCLLMGKSFGRNTRLLRDQLQFRTHLQNPQYGLRFLHRS